MRKNIKGANSANNIISFGIKTSLIAMSTIFFYTGLNLPPQFAFLRKSFQITFIDPHKFFTPFFIIPPERSLHCRAGHPGAFKQIQSHSHDGVLHGDIPGFTAWIPQREIAENKSRNAAFFDDIPCAADNNGG